MRCAFCRSISSELGNSPGRAFTVNTRSAEDCPAAEKMSQWFQKSSIACQKYHNTLPGVIITEICIVVVFPLHINNLISSLTSSCYASRGNTCQVLNLGSIIYPIGECELIIQMRMFFWTQLHFMTSTGYPEYVFFSAYQSADIRTDRSTQTFVKCLQRAWAIYAALVM